MIDKYSTLDPHGAERVKKGQKNFYKVLYHCFKIFIGIECQTCFAIFPKNLITLLQKCGEKEQ